MRLTRSLAQDAYREGAPDLAHRERVCDAQHQGASRIPARPCPCSPPPPNQITKLLANHTNSHPPERQTLSNLQSLTASLFGVAAGILGLESYGGFLFYVVLSLLTALLFYAVRVAPESLAAGKAPLDTSRYFRGSLELWTSGVFGGLAGFILTWTLFYGLVRA